jgi:hypothetical protein
VKVVLKHSMDDCPDFEDELDIDVEDEVEAATEPDPDFTAQVQQLQRSVLSNAFAEEAA